MFVIVKVAAECELSGPTVFDPYPRRQQCLTIAQLQHIAFSLGGAVPVDLPGLRLRSPKGHPSISLLRPDILQKAVVGCPRESPSRQTGAYQLNLFN